MAARLVSLGRQPLRFRKRARVNYDYAGPLCWSTRGIPETIRRNFQSGCLKVQLRTVLRSSLWCNGPLAFNGSGGPDIHIQESHRPDRNTGRRKGTGESGLGPIEARGGFEAGTGGLLAQGCGNFAEGLAGKAWAGEGRVRRTSYSCSNVGLGGACVRLEQQSGGGGERSGWWRFLVVHSPLPPSDVICTWCANVSAEWPSLRPAVGVEPVGASNTCRSRS